MRTRRLLAALAKGTMLPLRIIYIGTSGVYGDCRGQWVTESHRLQAQTPRAKRRLDAERCLRSFGQRNGVAISILRAPGIYAADRLPLERLRRGDPVLLNEQDVYTNHIHAADLAHAAALGLTRGRPGRVYNACDNSDLKMGDYFDLVADAFGLPRPPRATRSEVQQRLSPTAFSFLQESRRLTNSRLKRELRIRLLYPTVAEGLAAACKSQ